MIGYDFFYNGSLLIAKFTGGIDKDTLISFMKFIYTSENVQLLDKILVDYRTAIVNFNEDDLKEISESRELLVKRPNTTVTLVNSPKPTAMATMILENYYPKNSNYSICSTMECCLRLLNLKISVTELNDMIETLKHCYKD
jgi:hypothetical protein